MLNHNLCCFIEISLLSPSKFTAENQFADRGGKDIRHSMLLAQVIAALLVVIYEMSAEKCPNMDVSYNCECSVDQTNVTCHNDTISMLPTSLPINVVNFVFFSRSVSGIPYGYFDRYRGLRSIVFSGGNWSTVSAMFTQKSENLTSLTLTNSLIQYIFADSFLNLDQLTYLNLDNNKIIDVYPFLNLKKLTHLYLAGNEITFFNQTNKVPNLQVLDLRRNKLISEMFHPGHKKSKLETVWLSDNQFNESIFHGTQTMPHLKYMYMCRNRIQSIPENIFSNSPHLEKLDLKGNEISSIQPNAFTKLENLRYLYLSSNNIASITSQTFAGLTNISQLHLDQNKLKTFPTNAFSSLKKLTHLNLNQNTLERLQGTLFTEMENLIELKMKNNSIESIDPNVFQNLPKLTKLDMDNNKLKYIGKDMFTGLNAMKTLHLDNNSINGMVGSAFEKLESLESLYLRGNDMENLDDGIFARAKCKSLYLDNNKLTSKDISFKGLARLEHLYLSHNKMTSISLDMFDSKPKRINLQHNLLNTEMDNAFPESLTNINISHNKMKILSSNMFGTNTNLEVLDASYNNISALEQSTFALLFGLREIHLQSNRISTFDKTTFCLEKTCKYDIINLERNLITCHCKMATLFHVLNVDQMRGKCHSYNMTLDNMMTAWPCKNGECDDDTECRCYTRYTGDHCDIRKHVCADNECVSGRGECVEIDENSYICKCTRGFHGRTCQLKETECNPINCNEKGTCVITGTKTFECHCFSGYSGETCLIKSLTEVDITVAMVSGLVVEGVVSLILVVALIFLYKRVRKHRTLEQKPRPGRDIDPTTADNNYATLDELTMTDLTKNYQPLERPSGVESVDRKQIEEDYEVKTPEQIRRETNEYEIPAYVNTTLVVE